MEKIGFFVLFIFHILPTLLISFSLSALLWFISESCIYLVFFSYPAWFRSPLFRNCRLFWNFSCFQNYVKCRFGRICCQVTVSLSNTIPWPNRTFLTTQSNHVLTARYQSLHLDRSSGKGPLDSKAYVLTAQAKKDCSTAKPMSWLLNSKAYVLTAR